jgi:hypothetical protein
MFLFVDRSLHFDDNVQGVNDSGHIAEKRQEDVDPEMNSEPHLQENANRGQYDGKNDAQYVHSFFAQRLIAVSLETSTLGKLPAAY